MTVMFNVKGVAQAQAFLPVLDRFGVQQLVSILDPALNLHCSDDNKYQTFYLLSIFY